MWIEAPSDAVLVKYHVGWTSSAASSGKNVAVELDKLSLAWGLLTAWQTSE